MNGGSKHLHSQTNNKLRNECIFVCVISRARLFHGKLRKWGEKKFQHRVEGAKKKRLINKIFIVTRPREIYSLSLCNMSVFFLFFWEAREPQSAYRSSRSLAGKFFFSKRAWTWLWASNSVPREKKRKKKERKENRKKKKKEWNRRVIFTRIPCLCLFLLKVRKWSNMILYL